MVSFIDDTTVILPRALSLNMAALGTTVTELRQERLGVGGISLKWKKAGEWSHARTFPEIATQSGGYPRDHGWVW